VPYKRALATCERCQREFLARPDQRFCSISCASAVSNAPRRRRQACICEVCGEMFEVHLHYLQTGSRSGRYCSKICFDQAQSRKIAITCQTCGKVVHVPPSQATRRYCSNKCAGPHLGELFRKRVERRCRRCGKVMSIPQSQIKYAPHNYCSLWCQHAASRVLKACAYCHKPFRTKRSRVSTARYCSRECKWRAQVGIVLGNGISKAETTFAEALRARGAVFERNVPIGRWNADILFADQRLVIEFDGDYWHSLPSSVRRDKMKDRFLTARGYRVVRVREGEWKADPERVIAEVLAIAQPPPHDVYQASIWAAD
jgi:very-short-patch-repair endonuclease/endogenous inhibitor of DNA gyrase (YacG/DUF329 family)